MTSRPYFTKTIAELEAVFKTSGDDRRTLEALLHELGFRSTHRSQILKDMVQAANDGQRIKPSSGSGPVARAPEFKEPAAPVQSSPKVEAPEAKCTGKKPVPKPPVTNDAQNILRAWTALEVLSPQGYRRETDLVAGDRSRIARFDDKPLPWELEEKSRPKKRLYYELILGAIALGPAVEALLKLYADNRPDKPSMKGFCPLASILLDKHGCPLEEENSFAISSFAWGVPIALEGDLQKLADWPQSEIALMASFQKRMIRRNQQGEVLPLTKEHIAELFTFLTNALQLDGHETQPPHFALRRYEFFASKTPPEPGLLNSFFLEDLSIARSLAVAEMLPQALRHYLGIEAPTRRTDLLKDDPGLQKILQPALTPLGRWPGKGRLPLALLQQAAVNAAAPSLMKTGILAVNGPPGTGKTTLLRDVVAARIVDRATAMSRFKQPAEAFHPTNQTLQRSGAKLTLHTLDDALKGFEMVVTSSNNKAVENVSAELPALDAIADDAPDLRYLKTISNNVLERETWGIIAAVLGNSSNRYMFSQKFWRDEERGLSTYLNHASGIPQFVSEPREGRSPIKRNRRIVDDESPPANPREAAARWEKARTAFLQALQESKEQQENLQELHLHLMRLVAIANEIADLLSQGPSAQRPGFFARLFRTSGFKTWQASQKIEQLKLEKAKIEASSARIRGGLDIAIPDADFFAGAHEDIQTAHVWFDDAACRQRDDVFEKAMALHRAFIDCAADPLRQNLSVFIESFGTRSLGTSQKDALFADLWASFFLVVPVVSTTFASVHRMFSRLQPEALGWLLIDEAGQAVPQAAVGAMLRTKRAVVVGDPLQIEPVVTLPNSLTEEVCAYFGVDPLKYNAPQASVQTVSDAASVYCARFPVGSGYRDVGAPLLVHRRCDSPMFNISNEIAYSNLMVQAKKASPINPILGPSAWIHLIGTPGPDKWCADEASVLIDMLGQIKDGGAEPDLYVVTPFVIVQDNLRQELIRSRILDGWVSNPDAWVYEHVGTVHTVQGREAGVVFLVLGAQMMSQNGARAWAGGRPNLVNVAVTRAKASLYVIGNRELWKGAGVFATLDRYL